MERNIGKRKIIILYFIFFLNFLNANNIENLRINFIKNSTRITKKSSKDIHSFCFQYIKANKLNNGKTHIEVTVVYSKKNIEGDILQLYSKRANHVKKRLLHILNINEYDFICNEFCQNIPVEFLKINEDCDFPKDIPYVALVIFKDCN